MNDNSFIFRGKNVVLHVYQFLYKSTDWWRGLRSPNLVQTSLIIQLVHSEKHPKLNEHYHKHKLTHKWRQENTNKHTDMHTDYKNMSMKITVIHCAIFSQTTSKVPKLFTRLKIIILVNQFTWIKVFVSFNYLTLW